MRPVRRIAMMSAYFPPGYGGGGQQAARLIEHLVAEDCRVQVLTLMPPDRAAPEREEGDGFAVRRFRVPSMSRLAWPLYGLRAARWLARREDWDVLHLHGFGPQAILPCRAARRRRRPVLVKTTLLGSDDPGTVRRGALGPLIIRAYRRVEAIVALSAELEDTFRRDGSFRGQVLRIPNGVDTGRFRPPDPGERAALRTAFRLDPDALVLMTVGALVRRKAVDALIRAAVQLDVRPLTVLHAGPSNFDTAHDEELLHLASRAPAGTDVRFLGALPGARVAALMRAADLFVLPSRAEGLPNAVLEALASGLPCVALDIPGCRDVLADGGGVLVPDDDPGALASALRALAREPDRRSRLAEEGRRLVLDRYDLRVVARRYREVYDTLCADTGGGRAPA